MLGIVNAFDIPVRQSFVYEMVEKKEDLSNAIALNSSLVNMGRLIGPSIGGLLISAVGEGACFLINGISYIAVIAALFAMKIDKKIISAKKAKSIFTDLKEGFKYSFGFPPIRSIILLLSVVSLIGMPFQLLMPVFAKDILNGGPQTLGFLTAAAGIGSIVGAVRLASRKSVLGLGKIIYISAFIFGAGLMLFSQSKILWLSLILLMITGYGMITQLASSNTVLQTISDDDKRGRVMSFYTMGFRGMSPFGSLITGGLAGAIGAQSMILIGGFVCILNSIFFAKRLNYLKTLVRPIYIRKGIIAVEKAL
jgi:MFS family permease